MAYGAVVSLLNTLEQIQDSHRPMIFYQREQIEHVRSHFTYLLEFLENPPQRKEESSSSSSFLLLEAKIRDKAYEAEDLIESVVFAYHSYYDSPLRFLIKFVSVLPVRGLLEWGMALRYTTSLWNNPYLDNVIKGSLNIMKEVEEIRKQSCGGEQHPNVTVDTSTTSLVENKVVSMDVMVGRDDDLLSIKDQLTGWSSRLEIVPISGMGGIGKTTLAKQLYHDPCVVSRFDIRAWVTITQEYNVRDILLQLLSSSEKVDDEKMLRGSTDGLTEQLYKTLSARRYLIVMDDVWDIDSWDHFKRFFPDNGNGSRVILTTRLEKVADYAAGSSSPLHQMQLLNAYESWDLLCAKVFREERCPPELEEVGMKIARRCKGLPLAIVVVAGLLFKGQKNIHEWENVAENLLSAAGEDANACYKILRLSYNHLPQHLKACFLYMGLFPENHRITVSKLIKLWIAEGLLRKIVSSKTLEEVAEEYLEDLVERSLVLTRRRRTDFRIKTIEIHDLLRDMCIKEAEKESFLRVVNSCGDPIYVGSSCPRRFSLDPNISVDDPIFNCLTTNSRFFSFAQSLYSFYPVRSILYTGGQPIPSRRYSRFRLLRILDISRALLFAFPMEILKLVNLRYLAFPFHGEIPESISQLHNLETIVFSPLFKSFAPCPRPLPLAIWSMPRLRHLKFHVWYLSDFPCLIPGWKTNAFLPNLQSLSEIHASFCTLEVLPEVPNLRKIGIWMEKWDSAPFYVNTLHCLQQLEILKCSVRSFPTYNNVFQLPNCSFSNNLVFPEGLKELSLRGCRMPWKDMSIVGSLPNLERLKLRDYAFAGQEWEPTEGEFDRLNFLLLDRLDLVHWLADTCHFPSLRYVVIKNCWKLEKIPDEIGDIPTLEVLEVDNSSPSALNSAKKIAEEQRDLANDSLRVTISGA